VEPVRGAIEVALGRRPESLVPLRSWTCAERAFISIPGRVRSIGGLKEAEAGVRDLFLRAAAGGEVNFPENNVSKCGNVIACAPGREEAVLAAERAARAVLIRLEPRCPRTDAFLGAFAAQADRDPKGGKGNFPPDAFTLGPPLLAALGRIPDPPPPENLSTAGIFPFPDFCSSGLRDYLGRTVEETLEVVRKLCGLSLPLGGGEAPLGRSFWAALIRGGYQGAVYFLDNLREGHGPFDPAP
jgi:hypothetical protein